MKIFTRVMDCCIDCPNITDGCFCGISYDVWQNMQTLRKIPDPNTIPDFCPLPDVEEKKDEVKDVG